MIVQICGRHPSVADAPVIEGAERWAVNAACSRVEPWDVAFELHAPGDPAIDPAHWVVVEPVYRTQMAMGRRVVLQSPWIPGAEVYPLAEIQAAFAFEGEPCTSFQNSMDYLMALAIYRGATWIDVQGVELRYLPEYRAARETFRYWQGLARGRGIRVTVPRASGLDGAHMLYAYNRLTGLPGPPGESIVISGAPWDVANHPRVLCPQ